MPGATVDHYRASPTAFCMRTLDAIKKGDAMSGLNRIHPLLAKIIVIALLRR
jgi:hypothetical protein